MMDDMELVREFAATNSQRAFEALVSRHINLVYSAALRQVVDPHLAEEIAQAVFIILARKAGSLDSRTTLSGWLYRTARYVSADAIKMQRRRQIHEQEAYMQSTLMEGQSETIWEKMLPVLDEAMAQLRDKERDAVVLRFFENKSLREVGEALGLEERTAQKRIHRAVDKLRNYLGKRGVVATTAIITGLVSANSVQAAPTALTKTISIAAMGKGAAVGSFSLNLADKALKLIAWNKAKAAILVCVAVVISCGSALLGFNHLNSFANEDATAWTSERLDLVAPQLILRPANTQIEASFFRPALRQSSTLDADVSNQPRIVFTVLTAEGNRDRVIRPANMKSGVGQYSFGERVRGQRQSITTLIASAYEHSPARIVFSAPMPLSHFDYLATVPNAREALRFKIQDELNLIGRTETRVTDCLLLRARSENIQTLKPAKDADNFVGNFSSGVVKVNAYSTDDWSHELENILSQPVINQTALKGRFDIQFSWDPNNKSLDSINAALRNQLGLELVSSREPIEILVVEKAR